ncbi:MAG TPA: hypothetical protein VKM93_05495 [Terriglobia bacterium]|nr:hypothetical protein [Terriglobia bacterium]
MHNTILVRESKGFLDGTRLLEELDRESFPVAAAFWHRLPEYDTERLIIVSPVADEGSLGAYMRVQKALRALPGNSLPLSDILIMGVQSERFRELRRKIEGVLGFVPLDQRPHLEGYVSEDTAIYRWLAS